MKLLTKVSLIFDRTIGLASILASIIVIFLMLSVCMEVVLRYFLGSPTIWVLEVAEYLLLFIPFLAGAWVLKREGHVKVDLLLNLFNQRIQFLFNMITSFIGAIACFLLTLYGIKTSYYLFQAGHIMPTPLRVPRFIIIIIIFVGSFLLFIQFLIRTYGYLKGMRMLRNKD